MAPIELKDLASHIGEEVGVSDWLEVTQERVNQFADATGEPIFVPRKAGATEGDGWLLSVVYRGNEDRSDFLVFEAGEIAAGPIATAALPRRVPFGFHGNWRPA